MIVGDAGAVEVADAAGVAGASRSPLDGGRGHDMVRTALLLRYYLARWKEKVVMALVLDVDAAPVRLR